MFYFKSPKFNTKTFFTLFCTCLLLQWVILEYQYFYNIEDKRVSVSNTKVFSPAVSKTDKVVIGLVSCQRPKESSPENFFYRVGRHEQALVMMKAILISAKLYGVNKVDFHVFVENQSDSIYFHKTMARNGWVENAGVEVTMHFHNAMNVAPEKHKRNMIYHIQYRCGFVRMFFSSALPDVDSIIYLDSDVIVTGSVAELWGILGKMREDQLIGVARNNEPENHWVDHIGGFGDLFLHEQAPKGLNSGLLVMNLTKMRESRWEERFVRVYEEYGKILRWVNMEDQRTLNLMAALDPGSSTFENLLRGSLYLVPCNFDVMHTNCDHGWICKPALKDSFGIQAIHGAGGHFGRNGRFKSLYMAYSRFTWDFAGGSTVLDDDDDKNSNFNVNPSSSTGVSVRQNIFMDRIVKPIRKSYELHYSKMDRSESIKMKSKCYGTLDKLLFKNYEKFLV